MGKRRTTAKQDRASARKTQEKGTGFRGKHIFKALLIAAFFGLVLGISLVRCEVIPSVLPDDDDKKSQTIIESGESGMPEVHETPENRQAILSMGEDVGTVYITWKGDVRGPKYFRYSDDKYSLPAVGKIKAKRARILKGGYYRYKVKLHGLSPGRLYYYEIGDGHVFDSPRFFYAPEDKGENVFAYLGDPQFHRSVADYEAWGDLVWQMYKNNPDMEFAITGGDMVNVPIKESHWNGFLDNCGLFSMLPLMTIPGNHEGVISNHTYKKLFHHIENGPEEEAFYFFDYGHCRFIMLDSSFLTKARQKKMGKSLWKAQEEAVENWLQQVIGGSKKAWNIVVVHHPVYGLHDVATVSPEIREHWLPIMEEAGADLVLCGHQHAYMRTRSIDGIVHIMGVSGAKRSNFYKGFNKSANIESIYSSGPNYQIIRATAARLEITSYSKNGRIIDAAGIEKSLLDFHVFKFLRGD